MPEGLENASYNTASNTTSYGPQSYNPGLSSDAMADLASLPIEDIQNLTPEEVTILNNMAPAQRQALARQAVEPVSGTQPTQASRQQAQPTASAARTNVPVQPTAATTRSTGQATPARGRQRNTGTWKKGNSSTNWNAYTRQGLVDYLNGIVSRINNAKTDKEKDAIRQEAINTVNGIQNAYRNAYQANLTPSEESEAVMTLQTLFQNAGGNAYFNNIADNINLPAGHNTLDTQKGGWIDALWGPRTSIRNWGSTEYGNADYYKNIAALAAQAGLTYAPNADLTYGDNNQLYTLTLANNAGVPSTATPPIAAPRNSGQDLINAAGNNTTSTPETIAAAKDWRAQDVATKNGQAGIGFHKIDPRYRPEWLRYAGLLGPAVGLGMQALGLGKPNTKSLDAVLEAYDKNPGGWVDYQTIGDYLRYRPMDVWAQQNRMNANSRATDRTIQNNSGPLGTQIAGLVANNYVNQIGNANLGRQSLEYNDNKLLNVANFNKDTNKTNATAFNQAEIANAEIKNRKRQLMAQLGMQAAMQKADMNAGWYNGIYGNVAGLFRGIGELGRENGLWNMASESAADDVYGILGDSNTGKRYTRQGSKGGKLKRKKGLTF